MPNHPNRNWRAKMRAAASAWVAKRLEIASTGVRTSYFEAFTDGYTAGRASTQKPRLEKIVNGVPALCYCQRCERNVIPQKDAGDSLCPRCKLVL